MTVGEIDPFESQTASHVGKHQLDRMSVRAEVKGPQVGQAAVQFGFAAKWRVRRVEVQLFERCPRPGENGPRVDSYAFEQESLEVGASLGQVQNFDALFATPNDEQLLRLVAEEVLDELKLLRPLHRVRHRGRSLERVDIKHGAVEHRDVNRTPPELWGAIQQKKKSQLELWPKNHLGLGF